MWKISRMTYGFYEANETGEIRRLKKSMGARVGHILKPEINAKGYKQVVVSIGGFTRMIEVHQIIADCFIGTIPPMKEIHHKDHNRLNNNAENLEYVTRKEHRSRK